MDKTAVSSGENKQDDKGCKNKRKLAQPSLAVADFPPSLIEFPPYELPSETSQSLNEFNLSDVGSDWHREEPEDHMHELVDWNDPIAIQLEELLLSNLQAVFNSAIEKIVEFGYSKDVAEMAISNKALYLEEGDPVSNIVHDTLNVLKGKDVAATDVVFENLQDMLHYTMVEMISVVREIRPCLAVAEVMWTLLMCDLNISLACTTEDSLSDVLCNGESFASSSISQSKSEVQSSDTISNCSSPTFQKGLCASHQKYKSEAPKFGKFLNSPDNKSPLFSEGVKLQAENASLPTSAEKSSGTSGIASKECKSGPCSKRHSRKEIAALRQKFLHMEKAYRACGKGGFKSGKIGGLIVEKRLKPPSEIPNQQMKCGSSNSISKKGLRSADVACHVSTNSASSLPAGGSSGTLPTKDEMSTPIMNTNTSTSDTTSKPKSELSSSGTQKILDYCAGIPYNESLGKYVPRDQKDELVLKLIPRVQELQTELQGWNNWTNQKVMEVTIKLGKLQPELKILRKEKQEAELSKKDKKVLEENAMKRISEMENAMENTKKQIESATSAALMLEAENSLLKKELVAAKLWVEKSITSHQQALEREQMALKKAQSWESQNGLLRNELEIEKQKLSKLQHQLDKEKNLQAKVEGRLEQERAAKQKLLAQAASIRNERKKLEARIKAEEDMIRKKAANDLQKYVDDVAKLEQELVELKLKSESEKIAALRSATDEINYSFSRTWKSVPTAKRNKNSDMSQTVVNHHTKSIAGNLRREQECVMCLSEEMSVVFLPCAHQVMCPECNELHEQQGMKDCPSCRAPIQRRIYARFSRH